MVVARLSSLPVYSTYQVTRNGNAMVSIIKSKIKISVSIIENFIVCVFFIISFLFWGMRLLYIKKLYL